MGDPDPQEHRKLKKNANKGASIEILKVIMIYDTVHNKVDRRGNNYRSILNAQAIKISFQA